MANPDPKEELAKFLAQPSVLARLSGQQHNALAEEIIELIDEARSPFHPGRTTKRADFIADPDCAVMIVQTSLRPLFVQWLSQYGIEMWQMPSREDDVSLFATRPKDLATGG